MSNLPDKKTDIIDAAIEIVAKDGLQRTTTSAIADKAGIGEGTLYRYFENKDELFECAAVRAGQQISEDLLENYDPGYPVYTQYVRLCSDFLIGGMDNPLPHKFLDQFRTSPQGIAFTKQKTRNPDQDALSIPLVYPLNSILNEARKQEIVKNYPLQILASLTMGPLVFVLKDVFQGLTQLDTAMINGVAKACWDSIRR